MNDDKLHAPNTNLETISSFLGIILVAAGHRHMGSPLAEFFVARCSYFRPFAREFVVHS